MKSLLPDWLKFGGDEEDEEEDEEVLELVEVLVEGQAVIPPRCGLAQQASEETGEPDVEEEDEEAVPWPPPPLEGTMKGTRRRPRFKKVPLLRTRVH